MKAKRNGLLLYDQADISEAKSYIQWLNEEAKAHNIKLTLSTVQDLSVPDLPHLVINRSRHIGASLYFETLGIRVFNSSLVCQLGNDKLFMYQKARELGIPYLPLVFPVKNGIALNRVIEKPIFGHGGQGIKLLENLSDGFDFTRGVLYQTFNERIVSDTRHFIIANRVIHSIKRENKHSFLHNFKQGASVSEVGLSSSHKEIIDTLINRFSFDYVGIDILEDESGQVFLGEIEDCVGSRMLSNLGINNTTHLFLEHISKETF